MMDNKENDEIFLMISGIQHFVFCKRQWALIHLEQQWAENFFTVDGDIFHKKAHDDKISEKRGKKIISRGLPIVSNKLHINGICDVVEFIENKNGALVQGSEKRYDIVPIEYKRGKLKECDADIFQLVAESLCLEEMFSYEILKGYLFYGENKRRFEVEITDELKTKVKNIVAEMYSIYTKEYTPKAIKTKACNSCSLKDLCLPEMSENASLYIKNRLKED